MQFRDATSHGLISGMSLVLLRKGLIRLWNSILPEPGEPSAQLFKLIRFTACKKTKHTVSRWYCDRFGICTCKFKMLSQNEYYCDYWWAELKVPFAFFSDCTSHGHCNVPETGSIGETTNKIKQRGERSILTLPGTVICGAIHWPVVA